jgi:hypothetical protein
MPRKLESKDQKRSLIGKKNEECKLCSHAGHMIHGFLAARVINAAPLTVEHHMLHLG